MHVLHICVAVVCTNAYPHPTVVLLTPLCQLLRHDACMKTTCVRPGFHLAHDLQPCWLAEDVNPCPLPPAVKVYT